jgi:hypothetical protein
MREQDDVAEVRRCLRPPTTRRTRAPCPIGSAEPPQKSGAGHDSILLREAVGAGQDRGLQVRLSCNERLRPDQAKAVSLIVETRVSVDNRFSVRLDDPSRCFGAETIVA